MAGKPRSNLQKELLGMLMPHVPRRAGLLSERVAPALAEVGRVYAGRPAEEVFPAMEQVVLSAGGTPDRAALREFAEQIEAGTNPFT